MYPRRLALIAAAIITLASSRVMMADPAPDTATTGTFDVGVMLLADAPLPNGHVRLSSGDGELITQNGQRYYVPIGSHVLDGTSWDKLDTEVKVLQDEVTRKDAENKSLKDSLTSWHPGWGTLIVLTTVTALVGGAYYHFSNN